jgi:hypothetical protein
MKKFFALLLTLILLLTLAACTGSKDQVTTDETDNTVNDSESDANDTDSADNESDVSEPTESDDGSESDESEDVAASSELSGIMDSILDGVQDLPAVGEVPLDADNFEFYAFIDYADGYEGLASEAMINAIAHSAVLVKLPEGADVAAVAADIEANADPHKWICVDAEKTIVSTNGNYVLLVMSTNDTATAISDNFLALDLA